MPQKEAATSRAQKNQEMLPGVNLIPGWPKNQHFQENGEDKEFPDKELGRK
jgi:hypothetical protein